MFIRRLSILPWESPMVFKRISTRGVCILGQQFHAYSPCSALVKMVLTSRLVLAISLLTPATYAGVSPLDPPLNTGAVDGQVDAERYIKICHAKYDQCRNEISHGNSSCAAGCRSPENWIYASDFSEATPFLDRPDIVGIQTLYRWKEMEDPQNRYDFSEIRENLAAARSKGKKLWVQIQDRTFYVNSNPVPNYLHTPLYDNGSVPQCDGTNCEADFQPSGYAAAQWNKHVRRRFQALLNAMANELDGEIYGVNLAETAISVAKKDGYTSEGYFLGELENAAYAAKVFKKSRLVQYVNFWPDGFGGDNGYLTKSFDFYARHGIGVGGPDLIPMKPGQEHNSYPYLTAYHDKVPFTVVAVQEPDLNATENPNPQTGKQFTKEEFQNYAVNCLGVNIIFWATSTPWLNETQPNGR